VRDNIKGIKERLIKILFLLIFILLFSACSNSSSDESSGGGLFSGGKKVNNQFSVSYPTAKTYGTGEAIDITLIHQAKITVSGTPRIAITIGATTKHLTYLAGSGNYNLIFRYIIENGDEDLDGIEISNSLELNGATLSYSEGGVIINANTELDNFFSNLLTISTGGATIISFVEPINGTYAESSTLLFQINFSEAVIVSGSPRLDINIGGVTRSAVYQSGSGTSGLEFSYSVQAGEDDSDGITMGSSSINLNGGSIINGIGQSSSINFAPYLDSLAAVQISTSSGITAPAQVLNLSTAPTTSNTTLSLAWSKPSDNETPIVNYTVQYRQQGNSTWLTKSPNPTTHSTTVASLTAGIIYEFRVAANNGLLGEFSSVQNTEIFDVESLDPIAWLDATNINGDGTSPSNGTKIDSWIDLTGAATNATELTPANQPTIEYSAQNGLPAVRFNDHAVGLQGTFTRSVGTDLTFIVVGQFDNGSNDKCLFEFKGPGSERGFFIDRRYASNNVYSPTLAKGSFQLWRIEDNGSTAAVTENTETELFNGATLFGTDFTGTGTYVLGDDATGGNRMVGYIAEFLVFDKALSPAEISTLETYLKNKWGTP
jgi:hypothetical protein